MNGRLISGASSTTAGRPCWIACALSRVALSVWSISSVGKYVVSTLDVRRGSKGARMRRRLSKSTPRKKAWALISWAPPRPIRFSLLQIRLHRVS